MKNNSDGFSFVEMEMSLVIAAIIALAIGSFASISNGWYSNTKQESDLFSDISYTFRLLKTDVRSASSLSVVANNTVPISGGQYSWVSGFSVLETGNGYFGLYNDGTTTPSSEDLGYIPNISTPVPVTGLKIYPNLGDTLSPNMFSTCSPSCISITVTLNGKQNKIAFNGKSHQLIYNLSETISQRIK